VKSLRALVTALCLCLVLQPPSLRLNPPAAAHDHVLSLGTRLAEGDDFATLELGNPWDLTETAPPDIERVANVRVDAATAGYWGGVSTTMDPHLFLLSPGYESAVHWKRNDGTLHPIDTSRYHTVSFRMYLDRAGAQALGQFFWFYGTKLEEFVPSQFFKVRPGWHVYTFDLRSLGTFGPGSWIGWVKGLRLDPTNEEGVRIQLDWVRLTGDPVPGLTHSVSWDVGQMSPEAVVDLHCDTDTNPNNGFDCAIAENLPASVGSYAWSTHAMSPGSYFVHTSAGSDYASLKVGDSWDMSTASDGVTLDIDAPAFGLDGLTGITAGTDPQVFLHVSRDVPIASGLFGRLTFQLALAPWENQHIYIFWHDELGRSHGLPAPLIAAGPGLQTYSIDLRTSSSWRGQITQLRIDPAARSGVHVRLADVTLTTGGTDTSIMAGYSHAPIRINAAPRVDILEPSRTSGEDYATRVLNNPWDMSDRRDLWKTVDLTDEVLSDGLLRAVSSPSSNDPRIYLNTDEGRRPIDAERYRFLTYRFYMEGEQDIGRGWVSRWLWSNNGETNDFCTSDDIVVEAGWNVYSIDLAIAPTEPDDPRACLGTVWSRSLARHFRFDPHEMPESMRTHLDYVKLTALQEVDAALTIRWHSVDADLEDTPVVDLFYLKDPMDPHPVHIARAIPASDLAYAWDTRQIPGGTYYIMVRVSDGLNQTQRLSATPIVIKHQP
jgi:hypothetical protein